MADLPRGTVTFLFTDIEGSTRLLQELGDRYADVLMAHRQQLRTVFDEHGGVEVGTEGDSFVVAFARAADAANAATQGQRALEQGPVRVRMGIHTGEPAVVDGDYVGIDVHRAARISAAAHGGQVVISERTRSFLGDRHELHDLGLHRLKDLAAPEKLFQLGPGTFPLLRSLNATNLPVQPEPLIGRRREVDELVSLATQKRMVTLTGPGGTGKTRLALHVAAELVGRFPDGLYWIPIAALRDPDLVIPAVSEALGARVQVAEHIGSKKLLLLLDNLEQVLAAAPRVSELLTRCPNLHVLATSRAPLHIEGEREYPVDPLPDADAVALFRERAANAWPEDVVAEICRRVDRLPLAVELAAARTRILTPQQSLERLAQRLPLLTGGRRDAPERQRTLRATIEWSHDLLTPEVQKLFARLAVFTGSFDLDSAEAVADATLDVLERLVDESLLRPHEGRFFILETIREYELERLAGSGEQASMRERHARYFLDVAERVGAEIRIADPAEPLRRLAADDDNLRTAIDWAVETGAVDVGLRLCTALSGVWESGARLQEGTRSFARALRMKADADPRVRARALGESGRLSMLDNRTGEGLSAHRESVELWRRLNEPAELAASLRGLGMALAIADPAASRPILEEANDISAKVGDRYGQSRILHILGEVLRDEGDLDGGAAHLERSLAVSREVGARLSMGATLHSLGDTELDRGHLDRAETYYRDSLRNAIESRLERHKVYCIAGLAGVAARRGLDDRAAELWRAVERAEETLQFRLLDRERRRYELVLGDIPSSDAPGLELDEAVALGLRDQLES